MAAWLDVCTSKLDPDLIIRCKRLVTGKSYKSRVCKKDIRYKIWDGGAMWITKPSTRLRIEYEVAKKQTA